ncbi:hypothetical protein UK23_01015 [Lentzea aerocolonigenes]|uniref:Ricin B lectin domain-containing protein n=1 Tax=Lentzea aerocolonigenes TaxID=68170 RepID=A0A0F0HCL0_LENAE|nr:ricin-type beta-trefoil lectin domain protein [Lentzea aerocolonigenes]KJK53275.1 hypothetical protein UK23_01015 [Lentzea aerocolonigenes]
MTDATNTTGDVTGAAFQIGSVGRDFTINYGPPKRSSALQIAAVVVAVVVANLGGDGKSPDAAAPPTVATRQQQPTRPANDGPGYLVPSDQAQKAIDFYDNEFHDAVMWDRHPPDTNASHQPHWVREFSGPGVFRLRNVPADRCLEPVREGRGDHVVANVCSGAESQLWRTWNTAQFASVPSGGCLAALDGSYDNGTWLHVTTCTVGRPDQQWSVVR